MSTEHEFDMEDESIESIDAALREDIRNVIASQQRGVCPLMGMQCPGPENCAPARFESQVARQNEINESGVDVDAPTPRCPIVQMVMGVVTTASALLPLLFGPVEPEQKDETKEPSAEEKLRTLALEKLNIDQR